MLTDGKPAREERQNYSNVAPWLHLYFFPDLGEETFGPVSARIMLYDVLDGIEVNEIESITHIIFFHFVSHN